MQQEEVFRQMINACRTNIESGTFRKMVWSKYVDKTAPRKTSIRPVNLKGNIQLQLVHEFPTQNLTENVHTEAFLQRLERELKHNVFKTAHLYCTNTEIQIKAGKKNNWAFLERKTTNIPLPISKEHNREKRYLIPQDADFLKALGISSSLGKVHANAQKKYRQINRFIEILLPYMERLADKPVHVIDFGSGYGYLTFALYYYTRVHKAWPVSIIGVELRSALVDKCRQIAIELGYENLDFQSGDIGDYTGRKADVCIALHACDTASDLAILAGLKLKSELIVLAPCCHKQVRKSMSSPEILRPMLRHGVFEERTAEMLTDTIRALYLESQGYKVKTMEFIGIEHTPKNVMLIAEKDRKNQHALVEIDRIKTIFGVQVHYLDAHLGKKEV
jgi:SAM-dependent methyltransferase